MGSSSVVDLMPEWTSKYESSVNERDETILDQTK